MQETRPLWIKVLAGMLGAALCGHLLVTAVFVGPANAAKRSLGSSLSSYMNPLFQQNWSLFAPTPISVEYALWVRAWPAADGTPTAWVDATEAEVDGNILHRLAPSRAGIVSRRLAGYMRKQYGDITPAERTILADDYPTQAWDRMEERMVALDDHSSDERLSYVLRLDRAMTAYATQFAWATWGRDSVEYVEVKIVNTRAPRFADRGGTPTVVEHEFGLRPQYQYDGQDSAAFAEAVERFTS